LDQEYVFYPNTLYVKLYSTSGLSMDMFIKFNMEIGLEERELACVKWM
jgi:hypothetical protein